MEIESAIEFRGALITISLKRAEQEMELSEERFRQLTHALPTLIWTAEDSGKLTYVNHQWRDKGLGSEGVLVRRWTRDSRRRTALRPAMEGSGRRGKDF